ncbi:engulfment and cell motility protein 3 isoform X1 [Salmo salar]|uniref:Engulfment and cell motility protein 3-like isoform X1 n=2 Tax=Salmo salar TaxID=8030 RepID=A0A1S3MJV9_SALSA|nr:engulfment and cell motility protein 3-like isoform X1 [Salmo salar]XP_014003508.1 engulfment and cell motility protein 3-like isoform X1 [Salmo salar]XP_014003510.1 engulfment and cell motility protein 3-like isoform X1 [Salmo salar]|eukprot:XP_014003506.1 PREDICTED: engulfment and cell motility protein 3-like isoform X1 [Salmo salar]
MPQQKDIVKIAIQMPGAYPQLIQLDQKKPLSAVIKEVCDGWNLPGPDNYSLQYADGVQTYITESNRLDIKNGCILRLTKAPGRCAEDLYKGIQSSDSDVRCDSLKQLACVSTDVTFAQEFISRNGHSLLVKIVEDAHEAPLIMAHTLTGFMELMDHGIVSWENLSAVFIKKIASFVNATVLDASIQQVSLAILESMVLSSSSLFQQVKQEVTLERLLSQLQVTNQQIQTKAMALLMALLQTAGHADRQELFVFLGKKNLRQYIYKNIIHSSASVGDEMAHYLYVLQSVTLNHLEPRMRMPLDSYNQDQREILHGLRQAAFETESENSLSHEQRRSLCAKEFKKLGFSNNSNPGQDLLRAPPGLLALDTMAHFASCYPDAYSRFVLENSSREDKHECPFARSSIQLTLILCEILSIGEPPSETGSDYHPIFFAQDQLLDELFCICIQLLNKTWKEMRATQEDFDKVMQVVREQITRTLSSKPTSLELFKNKVNALNYSEIIKLRQTERLHQEETLAPPVLELKERLRPELLELIRQQRLNRLCQGTLFRKISSRRRQDKLWHCRLSPNHKVLHFGDVEEDTETPTIESLQEKIPVADIKALLTGKDCPHMKEHKGKQTKEVLALAFSVTYDVEEYSLNFIASSRTDFCLWTDGLSVLLGRDMSSECMRSELETLLSMEIKLRLLDLENVPIPDSAPPVPKPPSNFNFCYDFSQAEQ